MSRPIERRLRCGMPLIVETIPGVRSAGLAWLVSGGAARDPEEKQGLSAMWSDLLLRGAGPLRSREHADALDRLGVARSASAGTFFMRIGATLLGERLHDALPLIVDMGLRPRMDEDAIEPVRDLCIQAIEGLKDEPQERVMLTLRERHHASPLNRSGMGTIEGLERITLDDLVEGWRRTALPEGSIIAVAGHVNADVVEKRLNDLLGGWSGRAEPVAYPGPGSRGMHHEQNDTNQVHIALAHDAPREAEKSALLERVVAASLSGGMSGRLFTEVREKRSLCYSVYASYRPDRDYGSVVAYSGTTPERAQETLDVLMGELRRINGPAGAGGGIDESEFKRAIIGMKSRLVMSGESTSGRASALAEDWHKLGRSRSLEELTSAIDAIRLKDVNEHLEKRRLGRMTIVTIGPAELRAPE